MKSQYRDAIIYGALIIVWGIAGAAMQRTERSQARRMWAQEIRPHLNFARHRRQQMLDEEFSEPEGTDA